MIALDTMRVWYYDSIIDKTMLAERLPTLLPRLEPGAALEVTAIHSIAGTLPPGSPLLTEPPN
jgi:magnesium chelatase family protein